MRRLLAVLTLVLLGTFVFSPLAAADVNDFTITNFSADQTLTRADQQGELRIVERINVDFTDHNHGIIRAIPNKYKGNSLKFQLNSVTSNSGAPTNVRQSSSNDNVLLKIGDANRTVTGAQEYTIDYTLRNVITFYDDHDELYWDVNGDQWQQPFTAVHVTLHTPTGSLDIKEPICVTGSYGSTEANCTVAVSDNKLTADAANLTSGQTLTYVASFKKGYFTPVTFWERLADYRNVLLALLVPPLVVFVGCLWWWLRSGRDAPGKGTIMPEYAAPADLTPLEAGSISDFAVDNRDITATIIDLARRGYLTITEIRKDRLLLKDTLTYTLTLKNADFKTLGTFEQQIMKALFGDKKAGETISLELLKNKLYTTATKLRKDVSKSLTERGYFKQNPTKFAIGFSIIFTVVWIAIVLLSGFGGFGAALIGGIVIASIILIFFVHIMPARTTQGVAAREHLLGLKLYMETAEKDRLDKLEGPDAAYAANAGAPERTVELFEKLLPYAIVLGVETKWAGKFKDIYITPPEWYSGNWTTFNAAYLAGSLSNGFAPAVNSGFSAPSSSGSSGSGGGFSGGGGGGGGGGGW